MSSYGRAIYIYTFLILFAIVSLITGADYLESAIIWEIPNGNLLVVIGLLSVALLGREISWTHKRMHQLNGVSAILALLWYPLGILLSGNMGLNFSGGTASFVFQVLTIGISGWCFILLLISLIIRVRAFIKRKLSSSSARG